MTKIQQNLTGSLRLLNSKSSLVDKLTEDFKKLRAINNEYLVKLNTLENDSKILKRLYRCDNEPPKVQLLSKTPDLLEIGALCKAENHKAVIDEYQKALYGLHGRLTKYEGTKEEEHLDSKNDDLTLLKDSISSNEFVTYKIYEEEVASHNRTKQLLAKSENSVSQILKNISEILGFTPNICSNLNLSNLYQIMEEREILSATIVDMIADLQTSVKDKQMLMQNNKILTEELQKAKTYVLQCNKSIEDLNQMIVNQKEALRMLKDVGKRYKSNLIKEKRLNENIKMNKTFHLEKEYSLRDGWPHHDCLAPKRKVSAKFYVKE